jgi:hypothetical protein
MATFSAEPAYGYATLADFGAWPPDWPEALEAYRARAVTRDESSGRCEIQHQIPIYTGEELAALWSALEAVKTPGAPVTLRQFAGDDPFRYRTFDDTLFALVHVRVPSPTWAKDTTLRDSKGRLVTWERAALDQQFRQGDSLTEDELELLDEESLRDGFHLSEETAATPFKDRPKLFAGPPWPAYLYDENGGLPEYVHCEMVNGELRWVPGRCMVISYRARVDIMIYVRDSIDIETLKLPPGVPILDNRER